MTITAANFFDHDHVPETKYRHQIESGSAHLEVRDWPGNPQKGGWTTLTLAEEYTLAETGRTMRRTVSITLDAADRHRLAAILAMPMEETE